MFRDEDSIQAGMCWKTEVTEALQESECVLVFWSANSAPSSPVREEYTAAIELDKETAPVLLDDTPLPEELRPVQWIDCRSFVTVAGTMKDLVGPLLIAVAAGGVVGKLIGNMYLGWALGAVAGVLLLISEASSRPPLLLNTNSVESQSKLVETFAERLFDEGRPAEPCAGSDPESI